MKWPVDGPAIRVVPRKSIFVPENNYVLRDYFLLFWPQRPQQARSVHPHGRRKKKGSRKMKHIGIADTTLTRTDSDFTFKEKIEIARQLEKLGVNFIDLPMIEDEKTDALLVRTMTSLVKRATLSVQIGTTRKSIELAAAALKDAENPSLRLELPASPVGMEYICAMKAPKMLAWIEEAVRIGKSMCPSVEYCAVDATRAEEEFLQQAIAAAVSAGADKITICDSTGDMLPDDFAAFAIKVRNRAREAAGKDIPIGVRCNNKNGLASAQAILAVRGDIDFVKTTVGGDTVPLEAFAELIHNTGNNYGFCTDLKYTEMHRIIKQIGWITDTLREDKGGASVANYDDATINLNEQDDKEAVDMAVAKLGYDLSEEDSLKVYEEFQHIVSRKMVGAKELDAIVASVALQVPATYKLDTYLINNGNTITSSAQIALKKGERKLQGIAIGDGPIDAAIRAIEQIIGAHYDLDDFQLSTVTEGQEAVGSALIKLRAHGKIYSGNGISTDVIGASIRAYVNAVNKIAYEEA